MYREIPDKLGIMECALLHDSMLFYVALVCMALYDNVVVVLQPVLISNACM